MSENAWSNSLSATINIECMCICDRERTEPIRQKMPIENNMEKIDMPISDVTGDFFSSLVIPLRES